MLEIHTDSGRVEKLARFPSTDCVNRVQKLVDANFRFANLIQCDSVGAYQQRCGGISFRVDIFSRIFAKTVIQDYSTRLFVCKSIYFVRFVKKFRNFADNKKKEYSINMESMNPFYYHALRAMRKHVEYISCYVN